MNILIVNPDEVFLSALSPLLEKDGHNVSVARDMTAALQTLEQSPPGLVVMERECLEKEGQPFFAKLDQHARARLLPGYRERGAAHKRDPHFVLREHFRTGEVSVPVLDCGPGSVVLRQADAATWARSIWILRFCHVRSPSINDWVDIPFADARIIYSDTFADKCSP